MWIKIRESKDWILIILGLILILFAIFNLVNFNPFNIIQSMRETPVVEQEGFAPLFIPKEASSSTSTDASDQALDTTYVPERIIIEKIDLDAPVIPAETLNVSIDDQEVTQFLIPEEFAGGWHENSAPLGVIGNTVISGHHNAFGKVFANLDKLQAGDEIILLSGAREFHYTIVNKMILPEKEESLETRLENARWILPSTDERLTLVTCWPANSNTHRLILVAIPKEMPKVEATSTIAPTEVVQLDQTPTEAAQLDLTPTESVTSETATPAPLTGDYIVRNDGHFSVNIRDLPSIDGDIVGSFKAGDEAEALGRIDEGDWIYIRYIDVEGWVSTEVVEIQSPIESLPTVAAPTSIP